MKIWIAAKHQKEYKDNSNRFASRSTRLVSEFKKMMQLHLPCQERVFVCLGLLKENKCVSNGENENGRMNVNDERASEYFNGRERNKHKSKESVFGIPLVFIFFYKRLNDG